MEERRSKDIGKVDYGKFALAELPNCEWFPDVPWYPGSLPENDTISVTEYFHGNRSRIEAMGLATNDSIEAVTHWYLAEMKNLGWMLLPDKSRIEDTDPSASRSLNFVKEDGRISGWIYIKRAGEPLPVPTKPSDVRDLAESMNKLMEAAENRMKEEARTRATRISLSRTERQSTHEDESK